MKSSDLYFFVLKWYAKSYILAILVDWYKSWSNIVMISKEPTECGGLMFLLLEGNHLGLAFT
jgi:hypothetical protein